MKTPGYGSVTLLLFSVLALSIGQKIADDFVSPYGMRIHTTARLPLNPATIQADTNLTNELFASDNQLDPSTAWSFNVNTNATSQTSTRTTVEITNTTNQLILLGEKYQMWDNEASSMQMIIPDTQHAKTGYPGNAWPSVYNVAKWMFNVTREGEGMWALRHGMEHGEWVVAPMFRYDEKKWRVYWWNGTQDPNLSRTDVRVVIEVFSLADLSA